MDRDADFTGFVAARWTRLVRAAVLLGCSPGEAEDLTQTALARCYVSWSRVSRADSRDAYVYRVLVNCWVKSRRRRWWGEEPSDDLPPERARDTAEHTVLRLDLLNELRRLSENDRAVLVLRYVADMTVPEVADVLQIPVGTVKSRISRALTTLRLTHLHEETP
jgi:RNA polymerase sigma-70 factor (sigma-E family)